MIQVITNTQSSADAIVPAKKKLGQTHFKVAAADLPAGDFRGRVIESVEDAIELIPSWERLLDVAIAPNPFFAPNFLLPAMQHLGETGVSLLVIESSQRNKSNTGSVLCGLFPIVRKKLYGIPLPTLEIWKHEQCYDCTPLIRADCKKDVWDFILKFISEDLKTSLFSMNTVSGEGEFLNLLTENGFDNGRTVFQRDAFTRACFKPLEDEETFLMTNVAKSTRKGTARTRRKLEKRGVLETDFLYEYTPEIVQQFLELEASGWKGEGGTALKSQTETQLFLDGMLRRSMPQGNATVVRISLDARPIAMLVVLQQGRKAAQFKIAFDEQLKEYSPGTMVEFDEVSRMFADEIEFSDSCADPKHSMINRVWSDRVRFQSLVIASNKVLPRLAVSLMPVIQQAKFLFSK